MLLTGKAKKDFLEWYCKDNTYTVESFMLQKLYASSELIKSAYIIEWFDSVGIYIDIHLIGWSKINFTFNIYLPKNPLDNHCSYVMYETRTEATKQAIIKANELYNNRNNNQD